MIAYFNRRKCTLYVSPDKCLLIQCKDALCLYTGCVHFRERKVMPEKKPTQEGADTRTLLHALHGTKNVAGEVFICLPDTIVAVTGVPC